MKFKLIILLSIIFTNCASNINDKSIINSSIPQTTLVENENIFKSHKVTLTLSEAKTWFNKLEDKIISKAEYDSFMVLFGRTDGMPIEYEKYFFNSKDNSFFQDLIRIEYFAFNDSIPNTIEYQALKLINQDSKNVLPYLYLIVGNLNDDCPSVLSYINKLRNVYSLDNDIWLREVIADFYNSCNFSELAIKEYNEIIHFDSLNLEKYWQPLFNIYTNVGELDEAEELLYRVEAQSEDSLFKKLHCNKYYNIYWDKGEFNKIETLCDYIIDSTNANEVNTELYYSYIMQNKCSLAEEILWKYNYPDSFMIDWRELLGFGFLDDWVIYPVNNGYMEFDSSNTHYKDCLNYLKKRMTVPNVDINVYLIYGYMILANEFAKDYDNRNESVIRQGLAFIKKSNTTNNSLNFLIGNVHQKLNENNQAIKYFLEIQSDSKYYPYSLTNIAYIYEFDSDDNYIKYLFEANTALPENIIIINTIAVYYDDKLNYQESIKWRKRGLQINHDNEYLFLDLAKSYLGAGQIKNAMSTINKSLDKIYLEIDTNDNSEILNQALSTKGDIYKDVELWTYANEYYEKAIKITPDDVDTRLKMTSVFYQLKYFFKAENNLLTALDIEVNNKYFRKYKYKKIINELLDHYTIWDIDIEKELELLENSIKYFPKDAEKYGWLGSAYRKNKNYASAVTNLNIALKLNPKNCQNYTEMAYTYSADGLDTKALYYYDEAINCYKTGLDESIANSYSNESYYYYWIGDIYDEILEINMDNENYTEAISNIKDAMLLLPDSLGNGFRISLGKAYLFGDEYKKALNIFVEDYNKTKTSGSLLGMGLTYYKLGSRSDLEKSTSFLTKWKSIATVDSFYNEMIPDVNKMIDENNKSIAKLDWPKKVNEIINMGKGIEYELAKLYLVRADYDTINNIYIEGIKETTPEREYIKSLKEWITTSYNVSSKVYLSESLCDRFITNVSNINTQNSTTKEIKELFILAAKTRKEGMLLHTKGYYVKKVNYSGEYERGNAKIELANQYYIDGIIKLKSLLIKYPDFPMFIDDELSRIIDYYRR